MGWHWADSHAIKRCQSFWQHYMHYLPVIAMSLVAYVAYGTVGSLGTRSLFYSLIALSAAMPLALVSAFLAWYQERAEAESYKRHTGE